MTSCLERVGIIAVGFTLLELDLAFHFFFQRHQVYLFIVVLRYNRVAVDVSRSFHHPVAQTFAFKAAFVADKLVYFSILVLAPRYPQHLLTLRPQHHLSAAFVAVAMRVQRLCKPYAAFKTKRPGGARAHGAHVNHVSGKVVVYGIFDVRADLRAVAPIQHTVSALVGELIRHVSASIAEYAPGHVKLDLVADVDRFKRSAFFLVTR